MSDSPLPDRSLVRRLDEAGWTLVADRVIRGICHDLNGRANSLSSLTYLLDSGGSDWAEDGPVVGEEVQRLEGTVRLLRLLVDDTSGPELIAPGEILSEVASLVRLQPGLERVRLHVQLPSDFHAFRMDTTVFLRGMLLLLSGAAEEASLGEKAVAGVEGVETGNALRIWPARGSGPAGAGSFSEGSRGGLPANMETLLAGILKDAGGELVPVKDPDGEVVLEFRLPDPGA